jgi:hypothetical protein
LGIYNLNFGFTNSYWLVFDVLFKYIPVNKYKVNTFVSSENQSYTTLKYAAVGVWILAVVYVIALLCYWKSLHISLAILETASEFIGTNMRVVFVPLIFFLLNVIVFLFWLIAVVYLYSVGDIENGEEGT